MKTRSKKTQDELKVEAFLKENNIRYEYSPRIEYKNKHSVIIKQVSSFKLPDCNCTITCGVRTGRYSNSKSKLLIEPDMIECGIYKGIILDRINNLLAGSNTCSIGYK